MYHFYLRNIFEKRPIFASLFLCKKTAKNRCFLYMPKLGALNFLIREESCRSELFTPGAEFVEKNFQYSRIQMYLSLFCFDGKPVNRFLRFLRLSAQSGSRAGYIIYPPVWKRFEHFFFFFFEKYGRKPHPTCSVL